MKFIYYKNLNNHSGNLIKFMSFFTWVLIYLLAKIKELNYFLHAGLWSKQVTFTLKVHSQV